jgi:hypothetical protein
MIYFPARYLKVGQTFVYLGGTFLVLSRNNKGTVGARLSTTGEYRVISQDRLVRHHRYIGARRKP